MKVCLRVPLRMPALTLSLSAAVAVAVLGACGADKESDRGGTPAGGAGGSAPAGSGGTAGSNAGSSAAGSSPGGSSSAGSAGSAGAAAANGGASATGGAAGSGGAGGSAAGAGGSAAGAAGANAGAGGASGAGASAGGSAGSGTTGTATFEISVELASDVDPEAPTTVGIVTFGVDVTDLTEAVIEFGLDTSYGMTAPVDLALADHRTLLLGMKPERTYHFRVVARAGQVSYTSPDHTLTTGAATDRVPFGTFEVSDEAGRERGFIMASYWSGEGSTIPFILDADGEIVWWYLHGPSTIARARMSADGKNMWMITADNTGRALQRVTMDGLDEETYPNAIGSHDITPVSGETMAFLEYGEDDCDSIFEIDPSGTTREVFESEGVSAGMCHGNAVRYSRAEDLYTFSDVSLDIFAIDRQGAVQWRLSELVSGGNDAWGGVQHGHHLLADSIVLFANRGGGTNASAAIEYSLEGEELLNFVSGDFSQNLGDVQRLPGGNTLVTFSNDSIIKEIDAEENVVLEIDGGGSRLGYALWTQSLYDPAPDLDD